jgi:Domain of unknown function (DUF4920)
MKYIIATFLCCFAALASAENYGAPIKSKNPLTLQAALKQLDSIPTADVLIESKVEKVCVVKGCWMALTNAKDDVRVTFKDYGFFVPSSIIGKTVLVEGRLEKVVMSLEDTKHYVKDAGGDPSTVTKPRTEYRIVASGVEVKS